jgi:hypothetical protein
MVPLKRDEAARILRAMRFGVVLEGDGYDYIAIAAGSIDGKFGVTLDGDIFCDSAGDLPDHWREISGTRTAQGALDILASPELPQLALN